MGAAALLFWASGSRADEVLVAVIIDDIGDNLGDARRAVELPGAVTLAFLPHTPYAAHFAVEAHTSGKEVMLHLPMDSQKGRPLGPGGLTEKMDEEQFLAIVRDDIAAVPYVHGINNHMGSLMTRDATRMEWLMKELCAYEGLYFIDSRTAPGSVAKNVAVSQGIPSSHRDVFLDNDRDPMAIERQIDQLVATARRAGSAIGIAHPHPTTFDVLAARLPKLATQGIRLVPISEIIAHQEQRPKLWQASLSPSPPAAKNSKP